MGKSKLVSEATLALADLWYRTRDGLGVRAPHKRDLPLRELAPFMPYIALVRFDSDGRAKYELFGTQLVEWAGVDLTGHYLDETLTPEAVAQRENGLMVFHETASSDALRARWSVGTATTTSGRVVQIEDLALPYFDGQASEMRHLNFASILGTLDFGEGMSGFVEADEMIWFDAAKTRPSWLSMAAPGQG
ncbi:PAS domain-containing protein [Parvibaculaceae bacterium PLY_AMNH_Bact1]|nr:PAS domain-containing protein [Parvibaculaceae bacterium PLY_AMNH_Bact1]